MTVLNLGTTQTKHGPPILKRLPRDNPCVVEVGVLRGKLSHYLLESRPDLNLVMVDPWREMPMNSLGRVFAEIQSEPCGKLTQAQHDDNRASARMVADQFPDRAFISATDSISAAGIYSNTQFDMVFLDGGHWQGQVDADISAWWPLVKPGGWLGGHDYKVPSFGEGVAIAVDAFCDREGLRLETDAFYTWFVRKTGGD